MIHILIADDHRLFREGLARVLNDTADMTVVASVSDGGDAIARAAELRPDVALLDINMPRVDGIEAARQIHLARPQTHILMLTVSENAEHLFAAIRAGARGYLLKSMGSDELTDAIRRVNAGEAMIAPNMAVKLLDEFAALSTDSERREIGGEDLTERERAVLRLIAQGMTNKEIGAALALSPHTVKAHLHNILDKLHLRSRAEAAAWATRHSLTRGAPD
ncbi:MAG: response regulator transcription factor [Anaerolineae bacterium]